jgi:hypothetical protein
MRKFLRFILAVLIFSIILIGTSCSSPRTLVVPQLTSHPYKYNSKQVTVEGFYFAGFEIAALSNGLGPSTYKTGNVIPEQPLIWIEGNLGDNVYIHLYVQNDTPSGYPERYARVKVTGTFHYGENYGRLNAYKYMLTVTSGEILEWSPPAK